MIEVGDLVRIKNKELKGLILGRTRWNKKQYKRFRGKQIIARVIRIEETYDWRARRLHRLVYLDVRDPSSLIKKYGWEPRLCRLDSSYLVVHRKYKRCHDRAA
jgi:hypothetical protein